MVRLHSLDTGSVPAGRSPSQVEHLCESTELKVSQGLSQYHISGEVHLGSCAVNDLQDKMT